MDDSGFSKSFEEGKYRMSAHPKVEVWLNSPGSFISGEAPDESMDVWHDEPDMSSQTWMATSGDVRNDTNSVSTMSSSGQFLQLPGVPGPSSMNAPSIASFRSNEDADDHSHPSFSPPPSMRVTSLEDQFYSNPAFSIQDFDKEDDFCRSKVSRSSSSEEIQSGEQQSHASTTITSRHLLNVPPLVQSGARHQGAMSVVSSCPSWGDESRVPSPRLEETAGGDEPWYRLDLPPSRLSSISDGSVWSVRPYLSKDHPAFSRLKTLFERLTERTRQAKDQIVQPPTPSTSAESLNSEKDEDRQRLSFSSLTKPLPAGHQQNEEPEPTVFSLLKWQVRLPQIIPHTMDPLESRLYMTWLVIVASAFTYNAWTIFLRQSFPCVFFLQFDGKKTRQHYVKSRDFKLDLASLIPFDLLYLQVGLNYPILRLPRLLKIRVFWEFTDRAESVLKSANIFRIVKTTGYMLYMIHLDACMYYKVSDFQGLGSSRWVYSGSGNSYIRCYYWATRTLLSIGGIPTPTNDFEYLIMLCNWLLGVFVFAMIIAQIRDAIGTANKAKAEFRRRMDSVVSYMTRFNIPKPVQDRVRQWYTYTWSKARMLDEMELLNQLPVKMRTDLAIQVHMGTLSKVKLFQDCDRQFLRDLVLKLKPVLYLPGDVVCRKGEIGREMYIVNEGSVQVVGGASGRSVLATLNVGSYFGEISLLAVGGGNRRTADVVSPGFTTLFVLDKKDLSEAIKDYPQVQEVLKHKAKKLLKKSAKRDEVEEKKGTKQVSLVQDALVLIPNDEPRQDTPKLFQTVVQVAKQKGLASKILRYPRKRRGKVSPLLKDEWATNTSSSTGSKSGKPSIVPSLLDSDDPDDDYSTALSEDDFESRQNPARNKVSQGKRSQNCSPDTYSDIMSSGFLIKNSPLPPIDHRKGVRRHSDIPRGIAVEVVMEKQKSLPLPSISLEQDDADVEDTEGE
ncbi:cyclic nucleotide-gated cation channel beta-3-like [Branchiostoma floridae]|uniref:Cyclic nucleotide-gated cation channel beta-3-like n=1 Tax=Branchiostoma floridae TaxID=7739 RepID=A0A9J7KLP2_BRAFL|nr:cyclic nucleotide-gated cation channel beta-3-like [Branchiostoma floridae]